MSSAHSALYYHLVFGTKNEAESISPEWRDRLHAYLSELVKTLGGTTLAVGGVADHVHLLVSLKPTHQLSDVLRDLQRKCVKWVHQELRNWSFGWDDSYGAFTVSPSNIEAVRKYIAQQETHHRTRSFREEYMELLQRHGIEFGEDEL